MNANSALNLILPLPFDPKKCHRIKSVACSNFMDKSLTHANQVESICLCFYASALLFPCHKFLIIKWWIEKVPQIKSLPINHQQTKHRQKNNALQRTKAYNKQIETDYRRRTHRFQSETASANTKWETERASGGKEFTIRILFRMKWAFFTRCTFTRVYRATHSTELRW